LTSNSQSRRGGHSRESSGHDVFPRVNIFRDALLVWTPMIMGAVGQGILDWLESMNPIPKEVRTLLGSEGGGLLGQVWPEYRDFMNGLTSWLNHPHFAAGGIVTRPTMGIIGESGPEAVVPLSRGGGLGSSVVINFYAPVYGIDDLERKMCSVIDQYAMRSNFRR